jgi:hypothetical protein
MARFNEILVGRYNRYIQKLLSMKGSATVATISDEATPSFTFFSGVENRYLEGWNRFGFLGTVTASVGNFSQHQLRNPAGSNVIIVLERIQGLAQVAPAAPGYCAISVGALTTDLATLVALTLTAFDNRGNPQSVLVYSQGNPAANTNLQNSITAYDNAGPGVQDLIFTENQEIPLLPGFGLRIGSSGTNSNISSALWWRERFLEESERT